MYCPDTLKRMNEEEHQKYVNSLKAKELKCEYCDGKADRAVEIFNPADEIRNVEGAYEITPICDDCEERGCLDDETFICSACGKRFITHHSWDSLVVVYNGEQYCHKCALEQIKEHSIKEVIDTLLMGGVGKFVRLNVPEGAETIWEGEYSQYSDFPGHTSLASVAGAIESGCGRAGIPLSTKVLAVVSQSFQFSVALALFKKPGVEKPNVKKSKSVGITINDIERAVAQNSPYFFSKDTLRFFGQSKGSFKIAKAPSGKIFIYAPSFWKDFSSGVKRLMGYILREFTGDDLRNPEGISGTDFKSVAQVKAWVKGQ